MSEQPQAMSRERWPLLEGVNCIEMPSYLGTSPLAERQITDEIEWVMTGVEDNTFNGVVRAQLSETQVDQVIDDVTSRFRERNVALASDFDAVIGRNILLYLIDPVALLRVGVQHLRPGGIVAFQEFDFSVIERAYPSESLRRAMGPVGALHLVRHSS